MQRGPGQKPGDITIKDRARAAPGQTKITIAKKRLLLRHGRLKLTLVVNTALYSFLWQSDRNIEQPRIYTVSHNYRTP